MEPPRAPRRPIGRIPSNTTNPSISIALTTPLCCASANFGPVALQVSLTISGGALTRIQAARLNGRTVHNLHLSAQRRTLRHSSTPAHGRSPRSRNIHYVRLCGLSSSNCALRDTNASIQSPTVLKLLIRACCLAPTVFDSAEFPVLLHIPQCLQTAPLSAKHWINLYISQTVVLLRLTMSSNQLPATGVLYLALYWGPQLQDAAPLLVLPDNICQELHGLFMTMCTAQNQQQQQQLQVWQQMVQQNIQGGRQLPTGLSIPVMETLELEKVRSAVAWKSALTSMNH